MRAFVWQNRKGYVVAESDGERASILECDYDGSSTAIVRVSDTIGANAVSFDMGSVARFPEWWDLDKCEEWCERAVVVLRKAREEMAK